MLDEQARYGINAILKAEAASANESFNRRNRHIYEPEDYEGFKEMFGEDEPVEIEPESDIPFTEKVEKEKRFDDPETLSQFHHLEKYGYYYEH